MDNKTICDKYGGLVQTSKISEAFFSIGIIFFILAVFFLPLFKSRFVLDLDKIFAHYIYTGTEYSEVIKSLKNDYNLTDEQILLGGEVKVEKNFSVFDDIYNKIRAYKNIKAEKTDNGITLFDLLVYSELMLLATCAAFLIFCIINAIICFNGATLKNVDSACIREYNKALNSLKKQDNKIKKEFNIKYPPYFLIIIIVLLTIIQARMVDYNFFQNSISDVLVATPHAFYFENFCGFSWSIISYILLFLALIINETIYNIYKSSRFNLLYAVFYQSELNGQTETASNQNTEQPQ